MSIFPDWFKEQFLHFIGYFFAAVVGVFLSILMWFGVFALERHLFIQPIQEIPQEPRCEVCKCPYSSTQHDSAEKTK
jgi:hypothetical protein